MNFKLRNNADVKSLIYMFITTALFIIQWQWIGLNAFVYVWYLFMSVSVSVMTHNHNHFLCGFQKNLMYLPIGGLQFLRIPGICMDTDT
jgi:hypothetical protein